VSPRHGAESRSCKSLHQGVQGPVRLCSQRCSAGAREARKRPDPRVALELL